VSVVVGGGTGPSVSVGGFFFSSVDVVLDVSFVASVDVVSVV
jgi:hypothetical protein